VDNRNDQVSKVKVDTVIKYMNHVITEFTRDTCDTRFWSTLNMLENRYNQKYKNYHKMT